MVSQAVIHVPPKTTLTLHSHYTHFTLTLHSHYTHTTLTLHSSPRLCSMSHLRLHAGMCVLKLAEEPLCFDLITLELFQEVIPSVGPELLLINKTCKTKEIF